MVWVCNKSNLACGDLSDNLSQVLIASLVIIINFNKRPLSNLYYATAGAIAALMSLSTSIAHVLLAETIQFEQSKMSSLHRNTFLLQIFSATAVAIGFISIPRRPEVFFNGRPVHPQKTVSLWQRYSFSWVKSILLAAKCSTLKFQDLPVLSYN